MISLEQATEDIRVLGKWVAIAVGILLLLFITIKLGGGIKELLFPTPLPPPTFGKLPPILFPPNTSTKTFTYHINTISGTLPSFPGRVNVYSTTEPTPNLLAQKRAEAKLLQLKFSTPGTPLSESVFLWTNPNPPHKKLTFNIFSNDFTLISDFLLDPTVLSAARLGSTQDAIKVAGSFLAAISFPSDIDQNKTRTTLLSVQNGSLVPTTSISRTQIIRVDFFQQDVDGLPIYYSNPTSSPMTFYVGSGTYEGDVVKADFFHQNISSPSAMYPLKTADKAFKELQANQGYIAKASNATDVSIKNVYLGYFLPDEKEQYVMPIFVFSDDDTFYAYVSAIDNAWIKNLAP